jgi:hypothetical protein
MLLYTLQSEGKGLISPDNETLSSPKISIRQQLNMSKDNDNDLEIIRRYCSVFVHVFDACFYSLSFPLSLSISLWLTSIYTGCRCRAR